jgi:hypothetical protein
MNEVQLLRRQISVERQHIIEVNIYNSTAYNNYIMYCIDREQARAQAHIARLSLHAPLAPTEQAALTSLRHALDETANLDAADPNGALAHRTTLLRNLIQAAQAIEQFAERYYSVEDWRSVAQVNADSILEERKLWAEVLHHGTVAPDR